MNLDKILYLPLWALTLSKNIHSNTMPWIHNQTCFHISCYPYHVWINPTLTRYQGNTCKNIYTYLHNYYINNMPIWFQSGISSLGPNILQIKFCSGGSTDSFLRCADKDGRALIKHKNQKYFLQIFQRASTSRVRAYQDAPMSHPPYTTERNHTYKPI